MTGRLVVLASGAGTNLEAILDAIAQQQLEAEVVAVMINRRGARAGLRAERVGIPVSYRPLSGYLASAPASTEKRSHPESTALSSPTSRRASETGRRRYDADLAAAVARAEPDLVVLAGWMHLLSSAFLDRFPNRVINLHPALPGQFPGPSAVADAWSAYQAGLIDNTGAMVHYVPDESIDNGPVIVSVVVPIHPGDTVDSLRARIQEAEHDLIVAAIAEVLIAARRGDSVPPREAERLGGDP